ncbi:hypothetical protein [Achromobacter spanius]|uniref:hypothetical protein n=1 Tax=Achromobacter spanius TaxID=217203 RepID=UPI003811A0B6
MKKAVEYVLALDPAVQVSLISLVITSALSVVAGLIAWKTHETGRRKLKLDLFEKRFSAYTAIESAISAAWSKAYVTDEQYHAFNAASKEAKFLFSDPKVREFLINLFPHIVGVTLGRRGNSEADELHRSELMRNKYYVDGQITHKLSEEPDKNCVWYQYAAWVYNRRDVWSTLTEDYLNLSH